MFPSVLLLSAASGVAALIYELVWLQMLELVVGSTAVSLCVLLATFMGGTCLGSVLFPRWISPRHRPVRVYAALELGIGALSLLIWLAMPSLGGIYTAWTGYGLRGFLLRGLIAAICLLPPTLLMGATLPALARCAEGGLLYSANIAGGVAGCVLAGFYLLPHYDVATATYIAAAINLGAALWGWITSCTGVSNPRCSITSLPARLPHVAIALSGFCALAAECTWTRILGLLLGASAYALSIVLAVFLTGLGLGSAAGSLLSRSVARPRLALGWCQLLLAAAIGWTAYTLNASLPCWPIDPSLSSSLSFTFQLDLVRACWALLPPTLLWGASFPLALAASPDQDQAKVLGGIYAANTFGAIAGALGASLVLIPWIGSQHTQQVLITISLAAGLVLLLAEALSPKQWVTASVVVVLGALLLRTVPPLPPVLIAHGRYAASWAGKGTILYSGEGINSSVAVSSFATGVKTFHVAGKIQASSVPRDMRLQRMLGHLTTLTPAKPRSVLVIGCGAGITAGAVSIDPAVERVTIAEIEPLVPHAASTFFREQNFGVVDNPKVTIRLDDGRHYLLTSRERFDAITVDPLDPWVKGAANLYTKEFYEAAKQHLNPGGVITMYIQLFETTGDAVKSSLATFFEVFPNATLWGNPYQGQGHDMVLLGQVETPHIDLDEMERRLAKPEYTKVVQSLAQVGMNSATDLFATYAGRRTDLKPWLRDAPINRDRNLRMQYLAGLGLNLDDSAAIYSSMLAYKRFPEDMFYSVQGRVNLLRENFQRAGR